MSAAKKISYCAVISALAIIFGYIEALFPIPVPIPGVKLGLGNIAVIVCLYLLNKKTAFAVMMIKAVVTSILFSSPLMLIYSLSGGILSFIVMCIMKKYRFGLPVVSMGGGIFHNIGQLITAGLVLGNANVLYYAPFLIIAGSCAALLTGFAAKTIIRILEKSFGK